MLKDFDKITEEDIKDVTLDYNLHTHNYLCGHADGTVEDYVREAVKNGVKILGISDHIDARNLNNFGWVSKNNIEKDYLSQFVGPTNEFGDKITIYKAGEAEYYDNNEDSYNFFKSKLDYLILGQHCVETQTIHKHVTELGSEEKYALELLEQENRGIKSGFFTVLAHPDMVFGWYGGDVNPLKKKLEKIVLNAASEGMLIEINANGIRCNDFRYPTDCLIDICKHYDIPVIVSSDCHRPYFLCDEYVKKLIVFLRRKNIRILSADEIKNKIEAERRRVL